MDVDYRILILIVALAAALVVFFIRKNKSDREELEKQLNEPALPEKRRDDDEV